jgi:hypothetical protein
MSVSFRWIILLLIFILQIYLYAQNPKLFTNAQKCYNANCRVITFLIGIIGATLTLLALITLWYVLPFSDAFPDYWYIPVIIITYALIIQITISVKVEVEDGSFNPPPEYLINKKNRITLYVILTFLSLVYFLQLYLDGGVNIIKNKSRYIDHFILGRFGGIEKNNYNFFIQWFAIIKIFIEILTIKSAADFYACDYGLPISWDF